MNGRQDVRPNPEGGSRFMAGRRGRRWVAAVAGLAVLASVSGCSGSPSIFPTVTQTVTQTATVTVTSGGGSNPGSGVSSDDYGKQAICALGDAGISLLKAGGAGAKGLAVVIRDNTPPGTIHDLASQVADSNGNDKQLNQQLADWLAGYCG